MAQEITQSHLDFVQEAKEAFQSEPGLYTWRNENENLIALRYGMDRDCLLVYELGECIANFVQQTKPAPIPRNEVLHFSHDMESQLKVNEHKGGWEKEHHEFLIKQLNHNLADLFTELKKPDKDKHEITIRCANIANFAMMIADNEGDHL